eukprot:PhM_4_TR2839/c0_g1_i1/m.88862
MPIYHPNHFTMDERGIGGRHMIQQQFLALSSNVQRVHKMIDNTPPHTMYWSRRITTDKFVPYCKRVPPSQVSMLAVGKTDTRPPKDYALIANMYINSDGAKSTDVNKRRPGTARRPPTTPSSIPLLMSKLSASQRLSSSQAERENKRQARAVMLSGGLTQDFPPCSLEPNETREWRDSRQQEIREHLDNLRYRRWCRNNAHSTRDHEAAAEISRIADSALETLRSYNNGQSRPATDAASTGALVRLQGDDCDISHDKANTPFETPPLGPQPPPRGHARPTTTDGERNPQRPYERQDTMVPRRPSLPLRPHSARVGQTQSRTIASRCSIAF